MFGSSLRGQRGARSRRQDWRRARAPSCVRSGDGRALRQRRVQVHVRPGPFLARDREDVAAARGRPSARTTGAAGRADCCRRELVVLEHDEERARAPGDAGACRAPAANSATESPRRRSRSRRGNSARSRLTPARGSVRMICCGSMPVTSPGPTRCTVTGGTILARPRPRSTANVIETRARGSRPRRPASELVGEAAAQPRQEGVGRDRHALRLPTRAGGGTTWTAPVSSGRSAQQRSQRLVGADARCRSTRIGAMQRQVVGRYDGETIVRRAITRSASADGERRRAATAAIAPPRRPRAQKMRQTERHRDSATGTGWCSGR